MGNLGEKAVKNPFKNYSSPPEEREDVGNEVNLLVER